MYLDKLQKALLKDGYKLYPASENNIMCLTELYGSLPAAYLEFLRLMGSGTNGIYFQGESCFTDELFFLNEWGRELLEENESKCHLESSDFVFFMSQGCMFCYFNKNDGDNPPVYFYTENKPHQIKQIANCLSDFLWNFYRHPPLALEGKNIDEL